MNLFILKVARNIPQYNQLLIAWKKKNLRVSLSLGKKFLQDQLKKVKTTSNNLYLRFH